MCACVFVVYRLSSRTTCTFALRMRPFDFYGGGGEGREEFLKKKSAQGFAKKNQDKKKKTGTGLLEQRKKER